MSGSCPQHIRAKIKLHCVAARAIGRNRALLIQRLIPAIGNQHADAAQAIRTHLHTRWHSNRILRTIDTHADRSITCGQQVSRLGNLILRAIDMQPYAQRNRTIAVCHIIRTRRISFTIAMRIHHGCPILVDGIAKILSPVKSIAYILQNRQFGLRERCIIPIKCMAHQGRGRQMSEGRFVVFPGNNRQAIHPRKGFPIKYLTHMTANEIRMTGTGYRRMRC